MTVDDRWLRIQNLGLCKTCLYSHGTRSCRNNTRCGVDGCDARHHALLHSAEKPKASYSSGPNPISNYVVHHVHQSSFPSLLYRVIPITLHNGSLSVDAFAFIDEGSSITMLEKSLAEKLQLNGHSHPLCLQWTSNVTRIENDSKRVTFEISGINKSKRYKVSNIGTTNSLNLPTQSLPFEELKSRFSHLRGIPVDGYENASPQLLIGVDNLRLVVPLKAREGEVGDPTAVRTRLGWCVYGGKRDESTPTFSYHICDCQHDSSLDEAVKTYLTLDEVGSKVFTPVLSDEDTRATKIMEETTKRVGDRYESGLLWKYDFVEFPDSYPMCLRRLQCLERRMGKEPAMRDNIVRQIEEYQQKGYCHRATPDELQQADPRRTWYLPLGAVTNPKKPGKVRLIWDAAAKVDGVSLNAMLLKGPDQLTSLPAVLFRFRQYPVAVCGDIREMYHQILIREADRSAQRFLWRSDPNQQPEVFVMDVATFGSTSSPATAQYVKNINARLFADKYPAAVEEAISGHYIDDYVTSFRSVAEAKEVTSQVRAIHQHGGFELRQFCSNSDEVMQFLGEVKAHPVKNMCPTKGENSERVLGILWDTEHDELRFPTKMREDMVKLITTQEKPTKRQILRCVMTMFDPLGLLAPYLIFGKIIIQEAWRKELGWDEPVDDETHQQWLKWVQMLEHINDIGIQRCYFREAINEVEVHTFVDASEIAYSCVTYFRSTNAAGEVKVALVGAKSKVAPLKAWSIPRLELQACVLGARHMRSVIEGHSLQIKKRVLWSDSGTALSWINGDPRKFNRFVSFRICEILELTTRKEWRWVPSKNNPADEATKYGSGPYFAKTSCWFAGPSFLVHPEAVWPVSKAGLAEAYYERLDDEKLHTLLVEAESIVNSRPLTYLPLDAAESEALTPNHFLLGSSDGVRQPPTEDVCDNKLLGNSWNLLQRQLNTFWKRWTNEYLPTLTRRTKWFDEVKPVEPGELVVLVEDRRRNGWKRGRVLKVITNPDGRCRQAIVQTSDGTFRRSLSRLAMLEVQDRGTRTPAGFHRGEDVATRAIRPGADDTPMCDSSR
ncbi:uncharacterized protein LOC129752604 [Uranotaenia lowii]|uniref:uncharacterized protein LOC129752604 n=1 Tax=Uranotaenia lowii TaxID=190385 RepID=UPI00247AC3BF|nr:uncharacterized protein LOC129752604 [Uranotaenia lowii]